MGDSRAGWTQEGYGMLTREEIEKEAEKFFEWDGERNDLVTFTSAKLFAYHCAVLCDLEANLKREQKTPNR
jgi:hypothetical protein